MTSATFNFYTILRYSTDYNSRGVTRLIFD